jgi:hypothetical protein
MTNHPDTTVRVPNGDLGPVIGYQARSAYDGECCVNWDDGSVWFLGRLDCGGIFAQRWYEPDDVDEDAFGPWRDCPGPDLGVFASVDALEAAMAAPLPEEIYNLFYVDDVGSIVTDDEKAAWGRIYALEVAHLLEDGSLVETWAPPWADDPLDPIWDIDC